MIIFKCQKIGRR